MTPWRREDQVKVTDTSIICSHILRAFRFVFSLLFTFCDVLRWLDQAASSTATQSMIQSVGSKVCFTTILTLCSLECETQYALQKSHCARRAVLRPFSSTFFNFLRYFDSETSHGTPNSGSFMKGNTRSLALSPLLPSQKYLSLLFCDHGFEAHLS